MELVCFGGLESGRGGRGDLGAAGAVGSHVMSIARLEHVSRGICRLLS